MGDGLNADGLGFRENIFGRVGSDENPVSESHTEAPALASRGGAGIDLIDDGIWVNWHGHRAVHRSGKTFFGWTDSGNDVGVSQYNHGDGSVDSTTLATDGIFADDHTNASILDRSDGRIMAFYSGHGDESTVYYRTSSSNNDISSMGAEQTFSTGASVTYPTAKEFDNGDIRCFYRESDFSYRTSTDNGSTWAAEQALVSAPYNYVKVQQDPSDDDILHFAAFRHSIFSHDGTANVYYFKYNASTDTYSKADGTTIGTSSALPLGPADMDGPIYDASVSGDNAHGWDLSVDASGNVGIVYIQYQGAGNIRYRHAYWDGSLWSDTELCPAGGRITQIEQPHYVAGASIKYGDPSTVYLSRGGDSSIVQKWETPDGGTTWSVTDIYDADGLSLRPAPVANAQDGVDVLLCGGRYRFIRFGGYDTRIFAISEDATEHSGQTAGRNQPGQRSMMFLGSDSTLASGSAQRVPFDTQEMDNYEDIGGTVNLADDDITPLYTEVYRLSGQVTIDFAASGTLDVWLDVPRDVGGKRDIYLAQGRSVSSGETIRVPFCYEAPIGTTGDIYLGIEQTTGSDATIRGGRGMTSLSVVSTSE